MAALSKLLDVVQVEFEKVGTGAIFLMDLGQLGFRGMDFNVVMVSHLPSPKRRSGVKRTSFRNIARS